MTRHIMILDQSDNLEQQYHLSREYLDSLYHSQPTRLKDIPASDEPLYNSVAPRHRQHNSKPLGKTVI